MIIMQRRQFLAIACAGTLFADACKKDEPTPATIVQGYITDSQGKPVVGLEVEYMGSGGGGNPSQVGGFGSSAPYVSFSEKSWTDDKGFFKIIKVVPDGIAMDGTQIILWGVIYDKYKTTEVKKNGIVINDNLSGRVIVSNFNIKLSEVNEYLVTLK